MARGRRPSHRRQPSRPLPLSQRIETGPDGFDYIVAAIAGSRAVKVYRCPGCDHEIRPGIAHVAVWPQDCGDGDDRRHWHTSCWAHRATRAPTRKWS
ncbi:hypothetical protein [Mycolicibacter kumamotonensis]|uniref:ATP/GTP-binding protein n=1 Tax=Mycolicibacter kumamotonensis TaxID=354243 RepID=A0A1B8SCH4_9MYCO|nr:hypothetical protein [Mycolicibacter kumamotonensis]OBY30445.1 hypothetical protein ACT18_17490 [Mycolicibacter kumamotonensis]